MNENEVDLKENRETENMVRKKRAKKNRISSKENIKYIFCIMNSNKRYTISDIIMEISN